jgi:hypothetical protein
VEKWYGDDAMLTRSVRLDCPRQRTTNVGGVNEVKAMDHFSELDNAALPTGTADDWTLSAALAEVSGLWKSADTGLETARQNLYGFLGAIYEHAAVISTDPAALASLRAQALLRCGSGKQRKIVGRAAPAELLLMVALSSPSQGSLRSKYKAVLAQASNERVPANRESFKAWLKNNGGIVKALRDAVGNPERTGREPANRCSFESCADSLLSDLTLNSIEERDLTKFPYKGFTVVLFYVEPDTGRIYMMSELTNAKLVEQAVRLASEQQVPAIANDSAEQGCGISSASPRKLRYN